MEPSISMMLEYLFEEVRMKKVFLQMEWNAKRMQR